MDMYSNFAEVYDRLMGDVDYKKRTAYLCKLFKNHDRLPTLLLDVACGTGGFSNEFAKRGIEVIGIDMSEEMLAFARQKSYELGTDVLFLCQKAEELDLYGTVDGVICCLDSLNHITNYKKFCSAIARVSLFLESDRLFIFDVNTPYKHKEVLGDNIFILEEKGVYCVWQNDTNKETLITDITLDFFSEDNGKYIRSSEEFSERAYTHEEIKLAVESAGLELIAVYADMSEYDLSPNCERAIYVVKKS